MAKKLLSFNPPIGYRPPYRTSTVKVVAATFAKLVALLMGEVSQTDTILLPQKLNSSSPKIIKIIEK
jgi:hypothetical protein